MRGLDRSVHRRNQRGRDTRRTHLAGLSLRGDVGPPVRQHEAAICSTSATARTGPRSRTLRSWENRRSPAMRARLREVRADLPGRNRKARPASRVRSGHSRHTHVESRTPETGSRTHGATRNLIRQRSTSLLPTSSVTSPSRTAVPSTCGPTVQLPPIAVRRSRGCRCEAGRPARPVCRPSREGSCCTGDARRGRTFGE